MHRFVIAVSALALLTACNQNKPADQTAATGQTGTPAVNSAGLAPATGATATLADFVPRAAASDMFEVEAGKVAEAKGGAADVKAFGKMMVADHTKSTAGLKAAIAASGQAVTPPTTLPADKQALLDTLKAASPADFDKTYLDQQEAAHSEALTLMKAYADGGDVEQVKTFAASTAPVVQTHLDKVKAMKAAMPAK
jgi:putative membrane protein